jgi:hypothetical protein
MQNIKHNSIEEFEPRKKKLFKSICRNIVPVFVTLLMQLVLAIGMLVTKIIVSFIGFSKEREQINGISNCFK